VGTWDKIYLNQCTKFFLGNAEPRSVQNFLAIHFHWFGMWFTVSHNKNLLVFNVPFAFMAETGLWPWDSRSDFLCDKMNQLAFPFGMRLFLSQLFVCDKGQLYKDLNQATTTLPIQAWSIFFSQRFFCHHHCLHVNYLWKWKIRGKNDGSRNLGRGEKGMFAYFLLDFFFHFPLHTRRPANRLFDYSNNETLLGTASR